jgi:hypothetical protein
MRYGLVLLLSISVGLLVYLLSMRTGRSEPATVGFDPAESGPQGSQKDLGTGGAPPGYTYLQVAVTRGPSFQDRIQGFLGSLVLIVVGTLAVSGMLYGLGVIVSRTVERFLGE